MLNELNGVTPIGYKIGLLRRNKAGVLDQGQDGILWHPDHRVMAITDGIGGWGKKANGMRDLDAFERELRKCHGDIRAAILATLHPDHHSTFVGIRMLEQTGEQADLVWLGDSSAYRMTREGVLQRLTEPHTYWNGLLKRYPDLAPLADPYYIFNKTQKKFKRIFERLVKIMKEMYAVDLHRYVSEKMKRFYPDEKEGTTLWYIEVIKIAMRFIINTPIMHLASKREKVEAELARQPGVSVALGDTFLLCSDGMDLSDDMVRNILQQLPPRHAARILSEASYKRDDCSVGIIRVVPKDEGDLSTKVRRMSIRSKKERKALN